MYLSLLSLDCLLELPDTPSHLQSQPQSTSERSPLEMATTTTAAAPYAFTTLVTTDEYLPAALVLAHSLQVAHASTSFLSKQDHDILSTDGIPELGPTASSRSKIDLVALVTTATLSIQSIRALLTVYDRVIGVEPIGIESILAMQQLGQVQVGSDDQGSQGSDVASQSQQNLTLLGRADLGQARGAALSKLHAWRLKEYQKIVYLDADTLVLVSSEVDTLKQICKLPADPLALLIVPSTAPIGPPLCIDPRLCRLFGYRLARHLQLGCHAPHTLGRAFRWSPQPSSRIWNMGRRRSRSA